MKASRRYFLGTSAVLLGANLMDALTTPLWRWGAPAQLTTAAPDPSFPVTFVDVAESAGLTIPNIWGGVKSKKYLIEAKGSGLAFFDYDNDGWLDIFLTNGVRFGETYSKENAPTSHLYKNNRDGTFRDVTAASGLARTGWGVGVCVGDYDNDGWDDLFCTCWGHNLLFHNNGDGTFTDVTVKAGLWEERVRWGSGCSWLDYDRDGLLDLFVCNYVDLDLDSVPLPGQKSYCQWKSLPVACGPMGLPGGKNILYHNNGDGTFTDVSEKAGILKPGPRYSITSMVSDLDNDGWPDIYVAVDSQPSLYFRNKHDGTFEEIAMQTGCACSEDGRNQAGMGVAIGDYDCDGRFDIFKTNFENDTNNLYHNNKDGTFSDKVYAAGVARNLQHVNWGAGFVDCDNDGWSDIFYVAGHPYPEVENAGIGSFYKSPRFLFRNLGNGKFQDVSTQTGPGMTQPFSSRGCAFGDFDNDGNVDVLVLNMNDPPSLLRNENQSGHHWIKIKLLGTKCNRTAIGARIIVTVGDHIQMDEVRSGGSVMSQNDLRLHFGVGMAKQIDQIEVRWPTTGQREQFTKVEANQILTIREGEGIIKSQKVPAGAARRSG
ncbi:MAG: CRTAC1 family protein [Acidobacteria bacterium]|nr:CRTAC1 family protein [Acidobacteriota bacterium]